MEGEEGGGERAWGESSSLTPPLPVLRDLLVDHAQDHVEDEGGGDKVEALLGTLHNPHEPHNSDRDVEEDGKDRGPRVAGAHVCVWLRGKDLVEREGLPHHSVHDPVERPQRH